MLKCGIPKLGHICKAREFNVVRLFCLSFCLTFIDSVVFFFAVFFEIWILVLFKCFINKMEKVLELLSPDISYLFLINFS